MRHSGRGTDGAARASILEEALVKTLQLDIWSDIACPWCWIGKRRLASALRDFEHRDRVRVVWRAFELDPSAPPSSAAAPDVGYAERLARKYRTSPAQAEAMIERITGVAREDGLDFRFDRIRPGNTFDAHRLVHLGRERGRQDAMKERLFRAYLTEGRALSDPETLVELAVDAGIDGEEARATLANGAFASEVRADEHEARAIGVTGVPFFVLDRRFAVSGAQPADTLASVLARAWELTPEPEGFAESAACGPDGC
jgi:predicted DsbA family dithiol-disulfide isomerase